MQKFPLPTRLNGKQLRNEILAASIEINDFPLVKDDALWLDVSVGDQKKVSEIVLKHIGQDEINHRQSAIDKLQALGLTEDEITALL